MKKSQTPFPEPVLDRISNVSLTDSPAAGDCFDRFMASAEPVLVYDASGRILLCNDAFAVCFKLPASPVGLFFDLVFGKNSILPGTLHSEEFLCRSRQGHPLSLEFSLPADQETVEQALVGNTRATNYVAFFVPYSYMGTTVTLCLLKSTATTALGVAAENEAEHSLYEENRELRRINAQLRIENAERSAVAQALRRAESRYRDIFDKANEGIFQWTPDRRLLSANMAFARMMGYPTVNALFFNLTENEFRFCYEPSTEKELIAELEQQGSVSNFEFQVERNDGTQVWASMDARRVLGQGGGTSYYEAFIENISNRKLTEEKLVHQAFHDPLTGLANRALFHDRLGMAIKRAGRQPNYSFAVLYLDLDRFKIVNDSFGHNVGDDVLCHAAVQILSCVREVDTVARFGGDEFGVLIEEVDRGAYAVQVAKRIHSALCTPFEIKGQEINIGASIGIVLKGEGYELPEDILRDADTAMYKAKADRSVCYKVFSQRMRLETLESIVFETDLRQAIKDGAFTVAYQPMVSMQDGTLHGFEALLRWRRSGKFVSPSTFIPVAEETGLIKQLGMYMIEEVCLQLAEWKKRFTQPFVMHVNISGRQLIFPGFSREVLGILDQTHIDPSWILFEITESVLLDNGGASIQGIHHIRELGVNFCLDDFGTGFSSLSYLRHLPLQCIKVDRSFVSDLETDPHSLAIIRNLLTLGHDLGLSVIVEGVERRSQAEALMSVGCELAQGFYYHQPLGVEKAEEVLEGDTNGMMPRTCTHAPAE